MLVGGNMWVVAVEGLDKSKGVCSGKVGGALAACEDGAAELG